MTNSVDDITQARAILAIGTNTTEQHPVISLAIKKAVRKHGAQLIVADPRRIGLVDFAVLHLQLRAGTNIALLNGLANVILAENLYDAAFIEARTENFEAWRAVVEQYPPSRVSEITGVPEDDIVRAARIFGSEKPASIFYAMGITQHTHGHQNVVAIANLAMLTGNIGVPGGGVNPLRGQNNVQGACDMGGLPNVYTGYQSVTDEAVRARMAAYYGVEQPPAKPGLSLTEMIEAAGNGQVRALPHGREPGHERPGHQPRPRVPGARRVHHQPGHLPQRDDRVCPRRAALGGGHGEARHVHQHRAARAAGAPGAQPAGAGAARLADHRRYRAAHGRARLGLCKPRRDHGRDRRGHADLRWSELRPAGGQRLAVAVPHA